MKTYTSRAGAERNSPGSPILALEDGNDKLYVVNFNPAALTIAPIDAEHWQKPSVKFDTLLSADPDHGL